MKVKVSKEVAKVLDGLKSYLYSDSESSDVWNFVYDFIGETSFEFRNRNNITFELIQNIYKYGWEVEYEFQVGDVVASKETGYILGEIFKTNHIPKMVQINTPTYTSQMPIDELILICKKENREDLKQ